MSPLICDPDRMFDVVLGGDVDKKEHVRPVFVFRCRSSQEWSEAEEKIKGLSASECGEEALAKIRDAINGGLVGWRNMVNRTGRRMTVVGPDGSLEIAPDAEIPFAHETLMSLITPGESWDLYYGALQGGIVLAADLKKSASPSPTSTDESAADAKQEPST